MRWMLTPQDEFPYEMAIKNKCLCAQQAGTCAWKEVVEGGQLIEVPAILVCDASHLETRTPDAG